MSTPPVREQFLVISVLGAKPMLLTNVLSRACLESRCAVTSTRLTRHGELSALEASATILAAFAKDAPTLWPPADRLSGRPNIG